MTVDEAYDVEVLAGAPFPPLDTSKNQLVLFVGRKGTGKSKAARMFYGWWPNIDKVCIDVAGDADPGEDARRITDPLPKMMPARSEKDAPINLHYVADQRSPTYRDDLDRAVGIALLPRDRRSLLWIDEIGEVTQTNRTPPNLRTLLMQSRHFSASVLMCGPRPRNIDRLCVAQADRILIFNVPLRDDREYIADNAGIDRGDLEAAHEAARSIGPHAFVMWLADEPEQLYLCPPLPAEWLDITQA
jgi:hypothetical protein